MGDNFGKRKEFWGAKVLLRGEILQKKVLGSKVWE